MGMELFEPPNVAGWPGGLTWVSSGTLFERLKFAKDLAASESGSSRIRLENVVTLGNPAAIPSQVVHQVLQQLGLDAGPLALTPAQRAALVNYVTDGGTITTLDLSDAETPHARERVRGLIALVLQSAEAQMF
jgi:hypothetical protein